MSFVSSTASSNPFSTSRGAAKRIHGNTGLNVMPPAPVAGEDKRFTSPRGSASSSFSKSVVSTDESEYSTPREASIPYYSSDENETPPLSKPKKPNQSYYKDIAFSQAQSGSKLSLNNYMKKNGFPDPATTYTSAWQKTHVDATPPPLLNVFSLSRHNKVDQVKEILDRGLPVNTRDIHGNTILIIACQNGLKRLAKLVLRRGANINVRNVSTTICRYTRISLSHNLSYSIVEILRCIFALHMAMEILLAHI